MHHLGKITRQEGKASRQKAESSASLGLGCATAVRKPQPAASSLII